MNQLNKEQTWKLRKERMKEIKKNLRRTDKKFQHFTGMLAIKDEPKMMSSELEFIHLIHHY